MINQLLSDQVQSFIGAHYHEDHKQLLLKYKSVFDLPTSVIVDQMKGRKKAEEKLPTWYCKKEIIYPPSLNIEQASSEKAALNKIKLLQKELGPDLNSKTLLDLTGGFGVDSFFFSTTFKDVHFIEPDSRLMEIAKHNHRVLGASNIQYHNTNAEDFLELRDERNFDLIYIDPSRRLKGDRKVFSFNQSEPNIISLQKRIWQSSNHVLVKSSPLLDIHLGLRELQFVKMVYITSVRNECKELLFYAEKNFQAEPVVTAVNINGEDAVFSFLISDERGAEIQYSDPLKYLYEPNASLLKSGSFKLIGAEFNIGKLHPNTHLYTSERLIVDFPGRVFQIESVVNFNPKKIVSLFEDGQANVLTRNYPLSANEIRAKTGLKEGGIKFLIACTGLRKKCLLVATRIK